MQHWKKDLPGSRAWCCSEGKNSGSGCYYRSKSGRSQYGTSRSRLVMERIDGLPVVVIACIFQHSSSVLLSLKDSGIRTPHDLISRKVMLLPGDKAELWLCFTGRHSQGADNYIETLMELQWPDEGRTDAISAYLPDQPYFYRQKDTIPVNIIIQILRRWFLRGLPVHYRRWNTK